MPSSASLAQLFLSLFAISLAPIPPQNAALTSQQRLHLTQEQLCCFTTNVVNPIYPREARLAHTEGVVKLTLVISAENSKIVELQPVSGDPLLLESTMNAIRQWRFMIGGSLASGPKEIEVPLTFTFKIEDPPKPAFLHLSNGRVIRADTVREFTGSIEYTDGRHTHHISPDSVTEINACARVSLIPTKEGDCIPGGGPSFFIRAIPLLPAVKTSAGGAPSGSQTEESFGEFSITEVFHGPPAPPILATRDDRHIGLESERTRHLSLLSSLRANLTSSVV